LQETATTRAVSAPVPEPSNARYAGKNPRKSEAVMKAMLQMTKLDIVALKQAYDKG
jgi:hypothetical protein